MIKYTEKRASNSLSLDAEQHRELEEIIARLKNDIAFSKAESKESASEEKSEKGKDRGAK